MLRFENLPAWEGLTGQRLTKLHTVIENVDLKYSNREAVALPR